MKLGKIIKDYTEEHNISIREFARKCGLSNTYISNIVNKENSNPSVEALEKLASVMGYTTLQLFELVDDDQVFNLGSKPMKLTDSETELITKFRKLDDTGKHTVNTVLEMEYNRINNSE